jgi:hypothetical protein
LIFDDLLTVWGLSEELSGIERPSARLFLRTLKTHAELEAFHQDRILRLTDEEEACEAPPIVMLAGDLAINPIDSIIQRQAERRVRRSITLALGGVMRVEPEIWSFPTPEILMAERSFWLWVVASGNWLNGHFGDLLISAALHFNNSRPRIAFMVHCLDEEGRDCKARFGGDKGPYFGALSVRYGGYLADCIGFAPPQGYDGILPSGYKPPYHLIREFCSVTRWSLYADSIKNFTYLPGSFPDEEALRSAFAAQDRRLLEWKGQEWLDQEQRRQAGLPMDAGYAYRNMFHLVYSRLKMLGERALCLLQVKENSYRRQYAIQIARLAQEKREELAGGGGGAPPRRG